MLAVLIWADIRDFILLLEIILWTRLLVQRLQKFLCLLQRDC